MIFFFRFHGSRSRAVRHQFVRSISIAYNFQLRIRGITEYYLYYDDSKNKTVQSKKKYYRFRNDTSAKSENKKREEDRIQWINLS